jgi:rRNA small subunit pseudouridine methyltransferase Nep1
MHSHTILLEESSLELVPKKFWAHQSCRLVESRFGIPPEKQILDDNFHHPIIQELPHGEKRGRPDIVHYALLDIMSTPAYQMKFIRPIIHTINKDVIFIKDGVRPPRTELRFNGVMSKVLRNEIGPAEKELFENAGVIETQDLIKSLEAETVICLSTEGILKNLRNYLSSSKSEGNSSTHLWLVGGFAKGHFEENVKRLANELISISDRSLAAHVVTARVSYEIELSMI